MSFLNSLGRYLWNLKEMFVFSNYMRDEKIIIFGSWFGTKFADNSRYLFQYLSENKEKHGFEHVIWVTRDNDLKNVLQSMGYEVLMMNTKESIEAHKKAKIHVVCEAFSDIHVDDISKSSTDILCRYSLGAMRINLWHGIPAKGVNFSSLQYKKTLKKGGAFAKLKDRFYKNLFLRKLFYKPGGWGDCYMLSTTPDITKLNMEMMYLPSSRMIESNYPRNCPVIRFLPKEQEIINTIENYSFKVLYLPTFRDSSEHFIAPLSGNTLTDWIRQNNALWIQKDHSGDNLSLISDQETSDNVLSLNNNFDINVLLPIVDVVITDYSSVCFDAVYHRKTVLFYIPDFDYYMLNDRGFVMDPDEFMIGLKAFTPEELVKNLEIAKNKPEKARTESYDSLRSKVWCKDKTIAEIWADICHKVNLPEHV